MTLRNRIALTFSILTTVVLGLVLAVVYILSASYAEREFFQRMEERAFIAAQVYFKKDELNQTLLEQLRKRHLQTLPDEREYFVRIDTPDTIPADLALISNMPEFIERLKDRDQEAIKSGQLSVVGINYLDDQGRFAAILTARDRFGQSKLNNLRLIMGFILLIYLVLVFFIGRWYAEAILNPLSGIIDRMQLINTSSLHVRLEENKRQQDELTRLTHTFNRMLDRLETSVEAQNQFISNASHQLKNPLTAILGAVENGLSHPYTVADHQQLLRTIEEEANRLRSLVVRLLGLAHTGGNQEENTFSECRIDELIFELAEEFRESMPNHPLRIDFSGFPADAELLNIRAQRNLLKIALSNLIENAFKFSAPGNVTLFLKATESGIQLDITDRGIGIPENDLPNIFDPFFRAENARHLPGFGIGLPLVQKIISMHEGKIQVQSKLGEGTVFSISLPRLVR